MKVFAQLRDGQPRAFRAGVAERRSPLVGILPRGNP